MIRTPRTGRSLAGAGALLVLLAAISGCSTADPTSKSPSLPAVGQKMAPSLTVLFQQALKYPKLSQFERDAITRGIKSGKISQADYEEAHSHYAKCMKDAGFNETYTKLPSGVYQVQGSLPPGMDSKTFHDKYGPATLRCSYPALESLYKTQQSNPELLANPFEQAARCLVKAGLVPASYTADSLKADAESNFSKAPFQVNNSLAHVCLYDAGFAVSSAG